MVDSSIKTLELFVDLHVHAIPDVSLKNEVVKLHECLLKFYQALKGSEHFALNEEVEEYIQNLLLSLITSKKAVEKFQGKLT